MRIEDMVVDFDNKIRVVQINSREWSVVGGLLPQHGIYSVGKDPAEALEAARQDLRERQVALEGDIAKLTKALKDYEGRNVRSPMAPPYRQNP